MVRKPVGKGAWVALVAVALAAGTIGWRLVYDPGAIEPPSKLAALATPATSTRAVTAVVKSFMVVSCLWFRRSLRLVTWR